MDQEARHADIEDGQDSPTTRTPACSGSSPTSSRASRSAAASGDVVVRVDGAAGQADLAGVAVAAGGALGQDQARLADFVGIDQDQHGRRAAWAVERGGRTSERRAVRVDDRRNDRWPEFRADGAEMGRAEPGRRSSFTACRG